MAHCRHCDADVDAEALVRHETDGLLRVHCPECSGLLGAYRDPAETPEPAG
jgi:phage FluMu protein Com